MRNRLIDEIMTELSDRNILGDVIQILVTRSSIEELKNDYAEEFEHELKRAGRKVSVADLEEYFGIPLAVSKINGEEKYQLLTKV